MSRGALIAAVLALGLIAPAGAGTVPTGDPEASASGASTRVIRYTPFDADGSLKTGLRVVAAGNGTCSFHSKYNPRLDTWACGGRVGGGDPCYRNPIRVNQVACVSTPTDRTVIRLHVTYQSRFFPYSDHDWAIFLRSGHRCSFVGGATTTFRGERLNFACDPELFLYGEPHRRQPFWRILATSQPAHGPALHPAISVVWR